jgi:hypothetical protein
MRNHPRRASSIVGVERDLHAGDFREERLRAFRKIPNRS